MSDIKSANELHRKAISGGRLSPATTEFAEFMLSRWPAIYDEFREIKIRLAAAKANAKNGDLAAFRARRAFDLLTQNLELVTRVHQRDQTDGGVGCK